MEKNNDRRSFIKKAGVFIGLGVLTPAMGSVFTSCERDEVVPAPEPKTYEINLNDYPALKQIDGDAFLNVKLDSGDDKAIVIKRIGDEEFYVLDALCRHEGCLVDLPASPDGDINCPCHDVKFSFETGAVTVKPISDHVPALIKLQVFEFDKANNILKVII